MITSKTDNTVKLRQPDKSEITLYASGYGMSITVTDPDGLVVSYLLTPSDTGIIRKFLDDVVPMWDKDEI